MPDVASFLAHEHITKKQVVPYDDHMQEVNLFDGQHLVLFALVGPGGQVRDLVEHHGYSSELGAPLVNNWWFLIALTALFLLAVAVVPLRRTRNLDALALAAFTANIVAVNAGLIALSVAISVVLLGYLAVRCLAVAASPSAARADAQDVPLLDSLMRGWEPPQRLRTLGLLAGALLLAFLIITLTSTVQSTVAAASLAGATDLLHSQLPYGHIPYVLHGDAYPLLNYVLYLPGAALAPVSEPWSSLSGALPVTAAATLITAGAMWSLATRVLGGSRASGVRAVMAWLASSPGSARGLRRNERCRAGGVSRMDARVGGERVAIGRAPHARRLDEDRAADPRAALAPAP